MYAKRFRSRQPRRTVLRKPLRKKALVRRPRVSPSLNKAIKTVMKRNEEKKSSAYGQSSIPITAYNIGTQSLTVYDCRQVLNISQSAGQGGRVGNRINVTKCMVYGFLYCVSPAVITSNVYMRLVMLRCKADLSTPNGTLSNLYQFGNNVLPPVGNYYDMMRNFNKDYYTIYQSRKILLGSSDAVTSSFPVNNSVGAYSFSFDITKVFGGINIYNDSTTLPTNKACFLMFIPCNGDGSVITNAQLAPYQTTINSEVTYTDA